MEQQGTEKKTACPRCGREGQDAYCESCGCGLESGRVSTFLRRAEELLQAEDLAGARLSLSRACDQEPANPFAWMRFGQVLEREASEGGGGAGLSGARDAYRKLVDLRPLEFSNHMLFVGASSKLGELAQVEALYRHWASERPDVEVFLRARDAAAAELRLRGSGALMPAASSEGEGDKATVKLYAALGILAVILAVFEFGAWVLANRTEHPSSSSLLLGLIFSGAGSVALGMAYAEYRGGGNS